MRLGPATALLALLMLGATEGGCPPAPGPRGRFDPCAGKSCGETCTSCPPSGADCVQVAVLQACDPSGACVAATPDLCQAVTDPCAWRACGAECVVEPACRSATPPCMLPSRLGLCDRDGRCETQLPLPPELCAPPVADPGCRGKACGDACGACPPGADPSSCPVPTFAATACDRELHCVTVGTFTCGP